MGLVLADRVKETTTTTGTGTLSLGGAQTGYQTFVAGVGTTNTTDYCVADQSGANWEVGIGTVTSGTPDTLTRTTVYASSNAGALVNFGAGTKDVFCTRRAAGVPTTLTKTTAESRQSTTTLAADGTLVFPAPVGSTQFRGSIQFSTPSTGGFKYDLNFTGTLSDQQVLHEVLAPGATAWTTIASDGALNVVRNTVVAGTGGIVRLDGLLVVTVAGTLQVRWAQQSSQASNTNVAAGSWLAWRTGP